MASPSFLSAPILWERALQGFSEWQSATALAQQSIEDSIKEPGNLESLQSLHSRKDAGDPCKLAPYDFVAAVKGANDIKELETEAKDATDQVAAAAQDATQRIEKLASDAQNLELPAFASTLENLRKEACAEVQTSSALLEQLVSPDRQKRKGIEEIIKAEYTEAEASSAQSEAKAQMLKQVRSDRIAKREQTTIKVAQKLCDDKVWEDKLKQAKELNQQILDEQDCATELHKHSENAARTIAQVDFIVKGVEEAKGLGEQQLATCKDHKRRSAVDLASKRSTLIEALKQLQIASCEYVDAHIENEALRLKISSLEQSIAQTQGLLTEAQNASETARYACELWRERALASEQQVITCVETEAAACKASRMEPTEAATFNCQVANMLLKNVAQDNDAELSFLQLDQDEKNELRTKLEAEMCTEEPERDRQEVELEYAKLIDDQNSLKVSLTKCASIKKQLQSGAQFERQSRDTLKALFGGENTEEKVREEADKVANDSYPYFKLWQKAKPRTIAPSSALLAIDPNLKAWIEKMIDEKAEEKAQQKYEQLRADELFRRPASTAASSEAGESWQEIPFSASSA